MDIQQDSKHIVTKTKQLLQNYKIEILEWFSQIPGIDPIENLSNMLDAKIF